MKKEKRTNTKKITGLVVAVVLSAGIWFYGELNDGSLQDQGDPDASQSISNVSSEDIPEYDGKIHVAVNDNASDFTEGELERLSQPGYEYYSALDSLGRAGTVEACVGRETMPTSERESIGMIKPSGWHTVKYDFVDGKYLYNRCHLIGYQLTGENANECNLITGTRSFNTDGMLPFENEIADYVKKSENHVALQVTPIFEDDNLLASGVLMEAQSVEDGGNAVDFNVFVFNVEDGVVIDYATGESHAE